MDFPWWTPNFYANFKNNIVVILTQVYVVCYLLFRCNLHKPNINLPGIMNDRGAFI